MKAKETPLKGAFVIKPERFGDRRGFFARAWSEKEFAELGVDGRFVEGNLSHNRRRGTLRGLHYQAARHGQAKLVRCTRGAIFDVGVDLRPDSPTFRRWFGVELSAANRLMLYLPAEFAHGYLALEDDSEVYYLVTRPYAPKSARGVRWDDPAFRIKWPDVGSLTINRRDRTYPDFQP
ncbi:MAG TPA: dTDP-4-dehydrorhamnose 3,5-epimerase [Pyrinomonadaceae bacterium]|nr:dTDP-4-dehydrorhamnose 3,5-epimerase [Pyrinomonadaceae bacterium]